MSTIAEVGATPASPLPTPITSSETSDAADTLASDFDTFLQLLTTQLKNQDPSKPFDSTEFVGQLASFSSVEQQISTNAKLDELIASLNGDATSGLAEWVGKEVLSDAPTNFDGTELPVRYSIPQNATSASVLVHDEQNQLVERISVLPGTSEITWEGTSLDGSTLPSGAYRFSVESYDGTEPMGTVPAQTFSHVIEARLENGQPTVVFQDGSKLGIDNITAVRGASAFVI